MKTLKTELEVIQLSQVIEQLKQDDSSLLQSYSEYSAENGYDSVYDNDGDSINMMFDNTHDALRAAFYGEYNPAHAYFTFNGYGNLQSFEYLDSDSSPIDISELAEWLINEDKLADYDISVTTWLDMKDCIEDNINGDRYILSKVADYLGQSLNTEQVEQLKTDNEYYECLVSDFMNELDEYSYSDLCDLINTVGINYSVN